MQHNIFRLWLWWQRVRIKPVIYFALAEWLNTRKATISTYKRRLKEQGYLKMESRKRLSVMVHGITQNIANGNFMIDSWFAKGCTSGTIARRRSFGIMFQPVFVTARQMCLIQSCGNIRLQDCYIRHGWADTGNIWVLPHDLKFGLFCGVAFVQKVFRESQSIIRFRANRREMYLLIPWKVYCL